MHSDDPGDLAVEQCMGALFPGHPLGREVLGTPKSVEDATVGDIRNFFDTHYLGGNLVVSAAGDVDHDQVAAEIEARFTGRSGGGPPVRRAPDGPPNLEVITPRPVEQANLVVGMRGPGRHSEDRWAMAVLDHVLGGGISSRLFQEVREKRGLAYSVWSERVHYEEAGAWMVGAGTSPENLGQVLELVHAELDRLGEIGITEREMAVAKGHLRAETLLALEDSGARMSRIGSSLLVYGEVLPVEDLLRLVEAVTLEEVAVLAGRLAAEPRTLSVVGPSGW
jgi:predicted Zn-dependent peptidase